MSTVDLHIIRTTTDNQIECRTCGEEIDPVDKFALVTTHLEAHPDHIIDVVYTRCERAMYHVTDITECPGQAQPIDGAGTLATTQE